ATVNIPKNKISGAPRTVQVRALEIFTKDELYDQQILAAPPTDAAGHWRMAQFCERIYDFTRALDHYKKAADADPSFRPGEIKLAIERATAKAKSQAELDYMAGVNLLLARKKYDLALSTIDVFASKFPDSALIPDAKKLHDRIVKARDRDIADRVTRMF